VRETEAGRSRRDGDRIAREIKRNGPKSPGQAKLQELSLKAAVVAPPDPISGVK